MRTLREERRWSQRELAGKLGITQGHLSGLERGRGSFTAEQLLMMMQLFNVSLDVLAPSLRSGDPHAELQNALVRLGAAHLRERDGVLPSDLLSDVGRVIRETLVLADPRYITALAPILVRPSTRVNLSRLDIELRELGIGRRLPWVVDNVLSVLVERTATREVRRAMLDLEQYLKQAYLQLSSFTSETPPYDLLDATLRTNRSLDYLIANSSQISRRWRIASEIQPADFLRALEASSAGP